MTQTEPSPGLITEMLGQIPPMARPIVTRMIPQFREITSNPTLLSKLDKDADDLIDGIARKDFETVRRIVVEYDIKPTGLFGRLILRLMGG